MRPPKSSSTAGPALVHRQAEAVAADAELRSERLGGSPLRARWPCPRSCGARQPARSPRTSHGRAICRRDARSGRACGRKTSVRCRSSTSNCRPDRGGPGCRSPACVARRRPCALRRAGTAISRSQSSVISAQTSDRPLCSAMLRPCSVSRNRIALCAEVARQLDVRQPVADHVASLSGRTRRARYRPNIPVPAVCASGRSRSGSVRSIRTSSKRMPSPSNVLSIRLCAGQNVASGNDSPCRIRPGSWPSTSS